MRNKPIRTISIQWVNGMPEPYIQCINPATVKQLATAALSTPYEGIYVPEDDTYIADPKYEGLTKAEVMWMRVAQQAADGNLKAVSIILDRILGKPKQSIESTSMSMSYTEFLEQLAKQQKDDTNG